MSHQRGGDEPGPFSCPDAGRGRVSGSGAPRVPVLLSAAACTSLGTAGVLPA
jgi:hypothetical protein